MWYYLFNPNNIDSVSDIISVHKIFHDASMTNCIDTGYSSTFGPFPAGTHIGFMLAADSNCNGNHKYYTHDDLNPDGKRHLGILQNAAGIVSDGPTYTVGFEDLYNLGDRDYNDMMFFFTVTGTINELDIPKECSPSCVHGDCDLETGTCECDLGYTGESCSCRECLVDDCGTHGTCSCENGKCDCDTGWFGELCHSNDPVDGCPSNPAGKPICRATNSFSDPYELEIVTASQYPSFFTGKAHAGRNWPDIKPLTMGRDCYYYDCDCNRLARSPPELGSITYQRYDGIGGTSVSNLRSASKFPDRPDQVTALSKLSAPQNIGSDYGARMLGFLHPPVTGNYKFYVVADDAVDVWLSRSVDPDEVDRVAFHNGWTSSSQWTKYSTQVLYFFFFVFGFWLSLVIVVEWKLNGMIRFPPLYSVTALHSFLSSN